MRAMTAGKRRGFTLVEMLVVIAIIAILAALAFPALTAARASATRSTAVSQMAQIATALEGFNSDHGHYPWAVDGWAVGDVAANPWDAYSGGADNGTAHVQNNMQLAFWLAGQDTNTSTCRWDSFDKNEYGDAGGYLKRGEAGLANSLNEKNGNPAWLAARYNAAPFSHFLLDPWGMPYIYIYRTDKTRRCQAACLTSATCTAHGVSYSAAERQRLGRNANAPVPNEGFGASFELWSAGPDRVFESDFRPMTPDGKKAAALNTDNLAGAAYE